jgi:hypothetical protein
MRPVWYFSMLSCFLAVPLCLGGRVCAGEGRASVHGSPGAFLTLLPPAWGQSVSPDALAAKLGPLFAEWKAIPSNEMAKKVPAIKACIDAALTTYVVERLRESPRPPALTLQDDLNKALKRSIWESVFGVSHAEVQEALRSNASRPLAFVAEGSDSASDLYVAAFAIGYGNVFSTRVRAFGPQGGKYRAVNPRGTPIEGAVSDMLPLRSFAPDELRFVIWSLHIGSPEGLTTVAVDKFDGSSLKTLWIEEDVPAAKVTVREGLVVIESHSRAFTKEGTNFPYQRRFYQQVSGGLKQVKITRWVER